MTDEAILETEILEEVPEENRPDDEYIAAKLKVKNEFRKRVAAGLQRKLKRNIKGRTGTERGQDDEVWVHFKPTDEELREWINEERRGEKRIEEQNVMSTNDEDISHDVGESQDHGAGCNSNGNAVVSTTEEVQISNQATREEQSTPDGDTNLRVDSELPPDFSTDTAASDPGVLNDAPRGTWLGIIPTLRDGPQQP